MSNETTTAIVTNFLLGIPFFIIGLLVAPAFGYVSERVLRAGAIPLHSAMTNAKALMPPAPARRPRRSRSSDTSDGDRLIVAVTVALTVIGLYMKYRGIVLLGITLVALVVAIAATISIVAMSRKGVVSGGRHITAVLLMLYFSFAVGIVSVAFLWDPPAGGELFSQFLERYEQNRTYASFEGIVFIAYQILGAGSYLLVALISIAFSIAIMAAINLHTGTWGRWLWKYLFRYTSVTWSRWMFVGAVLLAAFSIACSGGWLYLLLSQLAPQRIEPVPSVLRR